MKTVGIIGLGWLGLELASSFKKMGFQIVGTTRSLSKAQEIKREFNQIIPYQLGESLEILSFNYQVDLFVLTIPPSSVVEYSIELNKTIRFLKKNHKTAKIVYTSSISVYGSASRNIDETSSINPETLNAKKIVEVERYLTENYYESAAIIRLAGLVGGNRDPVHYLSGKTGVKKPRAKVNLIHREDVLHLILTLMEHFQAGIFNLACTSHPIRKDYYNWMAEQKGLLQVEFDEEDIRLDKVVNCIAVKSMNFEFKYNSPYDFPISI
ncbi:MAG: NAD(P)-binding domain-containing protein [Flavobacteriales bacterium]|nr:NAD(P)-binding domain-containing protein [Flavobacteriales bacterium]